MRKIIITNNLTLDGVMQAPGRADEDTRGGFKHGGWALPFNDAVKGQAMAEGMSRGADLLFGRRTYEDFFKVWPARKDNPFSAVLDNTQKYVVSTTLAEPLAWQNSTLIKADVPGEVAKLREGSGKEIQVMGSGELVQTLIRHDLVDAYRLMVHPLVLGKGKRLFRDDTTLTKLRLVDSKSTTTGVLILTYEPDKSGSA